MNEHEIFFHANNSQLQIVQPELTTWKLSEEAGNEGVNRANCS